MKGNAFQINKLYKNFMTIMILSQEDHNDNRIFFENEFKTSNFIR